MAPLRGYNMELTRKKLPVKRCHLLLLTMALSFLVCLKVHQRKCCQCTKHPRNLYIGKEFLDKRLHSELFECNKDSTIGPPVHLSFLVGGTQSARQIVTLLKSVLHYINWSKLCDQYLEISGTSNDVEYSSKSPGALLRLHFIVDNAALQSLPALMKSWDLPGLDYTFYSFTNYVKEVNWIATTHYSGLFGLGKTMLDEILPGSVNKVIHLDTDLLLNGDITQLWEEFRNFTNLQAIGLVRNQSPWYLKGPVEGIWPALGYGYNTGVMMLDLKKLRQLQWGRLWRSITRRTLRDIPYAPLADQDIINAVLLQVSELLHELPCEWNVQLNEHVLPDRCPVQWKRTNDENNDTSLTARKLSSVKIVHFNNPHKPDSLLSSWLLQNKYNAPSCHASSHIHCSRMVSMMLLLQH